MHVDACVPVTALANKKRYTFFLDPDQLRQLTLISDASLGNPPVSALIRAAIADFIAECSKQEHIRQRLEPELRPRLVRLSSEREVPPAGK
jgi:hypothetical protein